MPPPPTCQPHIPLHTLPCHLQSAQTHVQVVQHAYMDGRPVTRLILKPRSGRRHQLRIHLQSVGHTIVGDVAYGSTLSSARMCLHAWALALPLASSQLGSKVRSGSSCPLPSPASQPYSLTCSGVPVRPKKCHTAVPHCVSGSCCVTSC
jgi:23S rRNA-/tRNA-specific pseudouridylate synthase